MAATRARKSNNSGMNVTFNAEKVTKNTIRFSEVVAGELDAPKVGTIYVPKATLKDIGYADGKSLVLNISAK